MVAPPPDQRRRNIGFLLTGGPGPDVAFNFGLRPEELTYQEPSRLQVQQTLGGAWADSFDRGVGTITISGTTGWRGTSFQSGEDMFLGLRETVYQGWHDARARAISEGSDPEGVQLYFTDSLDSISVLVAPKTFTLRRSKSSPLLMRYQIQLLVLGDADSPFSVFDPIIFALSNPLRWLLAVTGLGGLIDLIGSYLATAQAVFGAAFGVVQAFVNVGIALIQGVVGIATATVGVFGEIESSILSIGVQFCYAAASAFTVLADDTALLMEELHPIQAMSAAFHSAACAMKNAFDLIGKFPDYAAMRGASSCSSTGGGDPPSIFTVQDVNPFSYTLPSGPPLVSVTFGGQQALDALSVDPLQLRGQQDLVYGLIGQAANGVSVP